MKRLRSIASEQGSTLAITMIMLLIATLIGITAVTTSTTEVSMSGNYKSAKQAFYTADSVTQRTLKDPLTFDMTNYPAPLATRTVPDPSFSGSYSGSSEVKFLAPGLPPPGTSSKFFSSNYFVITTTATGPNNAQDTQIIQWAQVVPKS